MGILTFEDVNKGDEIPELVKGPLTQTDLVRYAGASGDFNPIHTVTAVAESVGLPGTIAHGMLLMAYAGQMLTDWAGPGAVRQFKVRFSGMTRPGDTLVCSGKVTSVEEVGGEGLARGRLTVKGLSDDTLRLKGDFTVVLPRRVG